MNNKPKIKILVFIPTLQCGGSEKFVSLLCNHINTTIFSVGLVVLDNSRPFYTITNPDIDVINLGQSRVRYTLFKIRRIIKQQQPDIVFTTANHLNLYFAIFRHWFPASITFIARESSIVSINSQRAKMPYLYNRLIKKYYRRFDFIICQSTFMQQDLVRHYNIEQHKTIVINNATEEKVSPVNSVSEKNANSIYKFITVARLSPEKGIERLIHAVGLISVPCHFFIIGNGPRKTYLQNLVSELQLEDKIFFKPENTKPFAGMEDADLFLMGSYYEGFPNVLLEAGSLGIPVIAFNVPGGISEIIGDGENGILVDDNDIIGFASAVNKALTEKYSRQQIIENTQKRFSVHTMLAAIEQLFSKVG